MGVEVPNYDLVEKILRKLPMKYDPKVSTLEDQQKLEDITLDELHGILTAYELRLGIDNLPIIECFVTMHHRSWDSCSMLYLEPKLYMEI